MPRDAVKLEYGVPQEIALAYATGRAIETDWGVRTMYTLTDGRVLFLGAEQSSLVDSLLLEPGELFTIEKQRSGRKTLWRVERAQSSAVPPAAVVPVLSRGTGTDGPAPVPQLAPVVQMPAPSLPPRSGGPVPANIAFREILAFVNKALEESGEKWSPAAKQAIVETIMESAGKQGLITIWERAA